MRWGRPIAALAAAIYMAAMPNVVFANHTADCSDFGYVNRHNGYQSDEWANHRFGVRARLENVTLGLCTNPQVGDARASVAYVSIEGPDTALPFNIVQVGMGRCGHAAGCDPGPMRDFWAWGRDASAPGCGGFASKAPTGIWFSVYSGGNIYSVVENANGSMTIDTALGGAGLGAAGACWTNEQIGVFTETWDFGDSLGGTVANPLSITNKEFRTAAGGAWQALPTGCNAKTPGLPAIFKCAVAGASLELWTSR